jgi:hypothetical protein
MPSDKTKLSSKKTIGDWRAIQPTLSAGAGRRIWDDVLRDYYYDRLKTRYLDPIEAVRNLHLSKGEEPKGEGFAIVAIQCSLVEFLESCYQGINYKHKKPTPPHAVHYWDRYAENHHGIAVEFDPRVGLLQVATEAKGLFPVSYFPLRRTVGMGSRNDYGCSQPAQRIASSRRSESRRMEQ